MDVSRREALHYRRTDRPLACLGVRFQDGGNEHSGVTRDVSVAGAFVETAHIVGVGAELWLELNTPATWEPISVRGTVRWVRHEEDPRGFGVDFDGVGGRTARALQELLKAARLAPT